MPKLDVSNDGIGVIDGAFSKQFCDKLISHFHWSQDSQLTWGRVGSFETTMSDEACVLDSSEKLYGLDNTSLIQDFNNIFFQECYPAYCLKFSVLNNVAKHAIYTYKLQKTKPSQGYHVWHCESDSADRSRRLSAYILYLNDVEEGGETEFLYLSRRIKPKAGRLVIFPAGYVHTHRGNPPLTGEKYILTGWLEFME